MPRLFGTDHSRAALLRRLGRIGQVAGIRRYTLSDGRADGVRAVEVRTGPMTFEVLPDRCLDLASLSYKGLPAAYLSKSGVRHPAYYAKTDPTGFHDNFFAGALSTCGLHNIGPARDHDGRTVQLHGDIGNMPAEQVAATEEWSGDDCAFTVSGAVRHGSFYHGDLVLRRRITARLGAAALTIEDEVENLDFAPAPCVLLYHCQFGFPFLGEDARLHTTPGGRVVARPGTPPDAAAECARFGPPEDGATEQCFYHHLPADGGGWAAACLFNPALGERGVGVYVRYRTDTLPFLVQWKLLRSREYVCGLEPAAAALDERDDAALALGPLETRRYSIELGFVEGEDGVTAITGGGA